MQFGKGVRTDCAKIYEDLLKESLITIIIIIIIITIIIIIITINGDDLLGLNRAEFQIDPEYTYKNMALLTSLHSQ